MRRGGRGKDEKDTKQKSRLKEDEVDGEEVKEGEGDRTTSRLKEGGRMKD